MDNNLIQIVESIPALIQNTHLDISLSGWPAAVAAIAVFGSGVIVYALISTRSNGDAKEYVRGNIAS